jgi:hypothetical protein
MLTEPAMPARLEPRRPERFDYRPADLLDPSLLAQFPTALPGDAAAASWPFLRLSVPHIWRTDHRHASPHQTGLISMEEALILHNVARLFSGRRALEIGCHFGWSTAHLVAAGLRLDVIDPALQDEDRMAVVRASLVTAGTSGTPAPRLWPGYSPGIIPEVAGTGEPYSFVFIDGDHEGDAPRRDAVAVQSCCAETAVVMFHDLNSPFVAAGLDAMAEAGWSTGIYETMQIMGIAWRGDVSPILTKRDANVPASPAHLSAHPRLHVM